VFGVRARKRYCQDHKAYKFTENEVKLPVGKSAKMVKKSLARRCLKTQGGYCHRFQASGCLSKLDPVVLVPPKASFSVDKMFLWTLRNKVPQLSLPRERKIIGKVQSWNAGENMNRPWVSPKCEMYLRSSSCLLAWEVELSLNSYWTNCWLF